MGTDASARPSSETYCAPSVGSAAFESFCRMFFAFYSPLRVEGHHHLPEGPFLLCSNHSSHADSAALMTASGRSFRSFALLGASDYFFRPRSVRWLVSPWMNVIPIERKPGSKSLSACLAACRRFVEQSGGSLILYPEGTRSSDGEMGEFKSGAGLVALELGLPVVPAYIEGTHRILPKGHYFPRSGHVTVRFGEALAFSDIAGAGASAREQRRFIVEQIGRSIRRLRLGQRNPEVVTGAQPRGIDPWSIHPGPTNPGPMNPGI
jgi:1-acyl-sn-glycerol-3-phosphate acyltransferase